MHNASFKNVTQPCRGRPLLRRQRRATSSGTFRCMCFLKLARSPGADKSLASSQRDPSTDGQLPRRSQQDDQQLLCLLRLPQRLRLSFCCFLPRAPSWSSQGRVPCSGYDNAERPRQVLLCCSAGQGAQLPAGCMP